MTPAFLSGEGGQQVDVSQGGTAIENIHRFRTPTGHSDGRGRLPRRLRRSTAFPLAVALLLVLAGALLVVPRGGITQAHDHAGRRSAADDPHWSGLVGSMRKMHDDLAAIERTGHADVDFVRLMLPHHQAAVDMARVHLLYGKDPQMRRLAQEIIADQQLEIQLMQLWLTQQPEGSQDAHVTAPARQ